MPTDFSTAADNALRYASELASKMESSLLLYHAYQPEKIGMVDLAWQKKAYNEQMEANLLKKLLRLKKKMDEAGKHIPVSAILGHSPAADNILGFAEDNQADLIVMGSQGSSGIRRRIFGSVAQQILEQTDRPVLLVPEEFIWEPPRQLVLASNFLDSDREALDLLIRIAGIFDATVYVVHLFQAPAFSPVKTREKEDFEAYSYRLRQDNPYDRLHFRLIETDSVTSTLENLHEEIPYDLLAMVRRGRTFLEQLFLKSFSRNMLISSRQPLLLVPAETDN